MSSQSSAIGVMLICLLSIVMVEPGVSFCFQSTTSSWMGLRPKVAGVSSVKAHLGLRPPKFAIRRHDNLVSPLNVFFKNKWDDPDYDPTKQEIDTKVPLHIAAFKGDVDEVRRLLDAGADVNEANEVGWTAIQWAARGAGKGQNSPRAVEVCQLLKERGANILSINLTGNTALHHAGHWGDPAVTKLLISWYTAEQVDQPTKLGWTALHWAAKGGHAEASRLLLAAGAKINARNMKGNTPLHEAAQDGSPDILTTLIQGGADLSAVNEEGETPLYNTAYLGFLEGTETLLRAGASPNCKDKEGATPLIIAARAGESEVASVLLSYKADVNVRANNGWAAIHEAAARKMGGTDVLEAIIAAGADINLPTAAGDTALHLAAAAGRARDDERAVEALLAAGADPAARDGSGRTALEVAVEGVAEDRRGGMRLARALNGAAAVAVAGGAGRWAAAAAAAAGGGGGGGEEDEEDEWESVRASSRR